MKTQWADNSLLLNGAVFYQDYKDFQLNTFTGIQFVVTSLPQVVSQGVDLDIVWYTPLEQLSLQGGVTYAETKIEDFGTAARVLPSRARERSPCRSRPSGRAVCRRRSSSPSDASLLFRANVGAKYTSEYNTGSNLDPRKIQDAFTLVNARLGFGADDERWMIEAVGAEPHGRGVLPGRVRCDAAGLLGGAVPTSTIDAFLGAPHTYGLTARFKF